MQPQLPLEQKTTGLNERRSGRPKWWSKPLRRSLNDSAHYTWYSARRKAHSARCKYVARATLSVPVRICAVAHFSDLSDSVFACVLGWMSKKECFWKAKGFRETQDTGKSMVLKHFPVLKNFKNGTI